MDEATDRCSMPDCDYLATQGEVCLKHAAPSPRRRPVIPGLDEYIKRTVDAAPPLSAAQADRIALLLRQGES